MPLPSAGPANIGIQGGYNWANQDVSLLGATGSADVDGGLLGGFVGYNHELGNNWVVGLKRTSRRTGQTIPPTFRHAPDLRSRLAGLRPRPRRLRLRPRTGLRYRGWAYARGFAEVPGFSEKETFNGYTVCVGVDYAFTDMMFGRIE